MCGIFGIISQSPLEKDKVEQGFQSISYRGPDYHDIHYLTPNICIGFHRLAIVGNPTMSHVLHSRDNSIWLACNGEIYNYRELAKKYCEHEDPETDCDIIIHMYRYSLEHPEYTFEYLLNELDGVFSFVLIEMEKGHLKHCLISRDQFGVRPLYYIQKDNMIGFASEGKALVPLLGHDELAVQFPPSSYLYLNKPHFNKNKDIKKYHTYNPSILSQNIDNYKDILHNISKLLEKAVYKRLIQTNRPVAFLLSGGLDSTLVAYIASTMCGKINTFSIGFEGSPDLINARKVANAIGSNHHEVLLTEKMIEDNLKDVIYTLESQDITTIRASVPMYLLSKYISENTEFKVIFSGEGSDEIFGGYLYFYNAPNTISFHEECWRLVDELHRYDLLRGDRTTSHFGLELRVPFLDKQFVEYVMNIDPSYKTHSGHKIEKHILRQAFLSKNNSIIYKISDILERKKEAFSDGVGRQSMMCLKKISKDNEKEYYEAVKNELFPIGTIHNICKLWMPKWNDHIDDPSATYLEHYNE